MADGEVEKKMEEKMVEKGGELLFCGGTSWDNLGRKGTPIEANLISPTRLRPLIGVDILSVASGGTSCHCVALDVEGRCYTWGRNDKGQLGHGDTLQRDTPTIVSGLSKYKIIRAGAGRAHTLVVTEDGKSFSFGWNKHGQLGTGSLKNEFELSPVCCLVSEVTTAVCGADFTVWLTSSEGESILTAGLPQYGQLGHGTDNEYNTKDSSVKLAYEPQPSPKAIASFAGKTIVKVACGTNHTVAVDSKGFLYTWGYGGHGRLGHREQKDEWSPRPVEVFQRQNVLPPNAVVSAGSANSACTAGGGQLYIWGKVKSSGDDWMYPKPLLDLRIVEMAGFLGSTSYTASPLAYMASKSYLRIGDLYSIPSVHHQLDHFPTLLSFVTSGWNIRCMDSGSMHHFVGADDSCISWGLSQYGELGYGPMGPKSSANPKKVEILNGMHVISVACGLGHSMIVVDRTNAADKLDQLEIYECKATLEGNGEIPKAKVAAAKKATRNIAVKASSNGKKRKSKDSSESEEEEENDSDDEGENSSEDDGGNSSEDSDGDINDKKEQRGVKTSSRGRGRGAKKPSVGQSTGRGRGRPPAEEKKSSQRGRGTGKRGRPRKS